MVDINELQPGMRVKIVDFWVPGCDQNPEGKMDKWLGKTMTVMSIVNSEYPCAKMEEDKNERSGFGWSWYAYSIDYIVEEECIEESFTPADNMEVFL